MVQETQDLVCLSGGRTYITHEEHDAFRVRKGSVFLYIVPWTDKGAGRRSLLCELEEGEVFLAFAYKDTEYSTWRFCLTARSYAELECMKNSCTLPLKKSFLRRHGLMLSPRESYENTLVDKYRMNLVKEDGYLLRVMENRKTVHRQAKQLLDSVFADENVEDTTLLKLGIKGVKAAAVVAVLFKSVGTVTAAAFFVLSLKEGWKVVWLYLFGLIGIFIMAWNQSDIRQLGLDVGHTVKNAIYHRFFALTESTFRDYESTVLAGYAIMLGERTGRFVRNAATSIVSFGVAIPLIVQMGVYLAGYTRIAFIVNLLFVAILFLMETVELQNREAEAHIAGKSSSLLYQFLRGIEKLRLSGTEEQAAFKYISPLARQKKKVAKKESFLDGCHAVLAVSVEVLIFMFLVAGAKGLTVDMGLFLAFICAFCLWSQALAAGVHAFVLCRHDLNWINRMADLFEMPENNKEASRVSVGEISGNIDIRHISFQYNEDGPPLFNDFSLHIKSGEYLGIVGESGCGKTTLLRLILGFEKPLDGKIYFDNMDASELDAVGLRKSFGIVLQDGMLLSGTIADNIRITKPGASDEELDRAVELAGLREELDKMPMGLNTIVDEKSSTLSGGQRQRILIARALINQPKIILFDEATGSLDNMTQRKVCEILEMMDSTRIVIAHRLSTIRNCDRILVMEEGRIIEEGSYAALMKRKGKFYQMALCQKM